MSAWTNVFLQIKDKDIDIRKIQRYGLCKLNLNIWILVVLLTKLNINKFFPMINFSLNRPKGTMLWKVVLYCVYFFEVFYWQNVLSTKVNRGLGFDVLCPLCPFVSFKNPAYGRHRMSRPMRIEAPISIKYAFCIKKRKKKKGKKEEKGRGMSKKVK